MVHILELIVFAGEERPAGNDLKARLLRGIGFSWAKSDNALWIRLFYF